MIFQLGVRRPRHRIRIDAGVDDQHRVHALFAARGDADHGGVANAGHVLQHPFDVLRKDVQPFGRDDHLLLPPADEHLAVGGDLADIAGVKPAVFEGARRFVGGVEVAGRHVLAADEDLAVGGDLHLDARHRLADRSLPGAEGMVQADDRRRFGQPVSLDDDEAELRPEGFELRLEGRGADDEAPELESEQPMDAPVPPPALRDVLLRSRRRRLRRRAPHVLAQHIENLGHGDEHGHPPRPDLRDDIGRVVAAHEQHRAGQHRRDERRHRLSEHVAQRQQIQEAQREERPAPPPVLQHFALDRHDVRQHVPVRDDNAFGLGGRPRREDDLGHIVAADRRRTEVVRCRIRIPIELVQLPDLRAVDRDRRHVLTDEDEPGSDDPADPREKFRRGAIIDRNHDDAVKQASPERNDPLRTVFAPEHNLVARAESEPAQPGRKSAGGAPDLPVGVPAGPEAIVVHEKIAAGAGEVVEEIDERIASHA